MNRSPQGWEQRAECRNAEDPDAFYVKTADFEGTISERRREWDERMDYAKSFCARCPVRAECLGSAFEADEVRGVAGGLTEREQRKLFKAERARRAESRTKGDPAVA